MSKKSWFKKESKPVETEPRSVKEITEEWNTVCANAGNAHFKMKVAEAELQSYLQRQALLHSENQKAIDRLKHTEDQLKKAKTKDEPK